MSTCTSNSQSAGWTAACDFCGLTGAIKLRFDFTRSGEKMTDSSRIVGSLRLWPLQIVRSLSLCNWWVQQRKLWEWRAEMQISRDPVHPPNSPNEAASLAYGFPNPSKFLRQFAVFGSCPWFSVRLGTHSHTHTYTFLRSFNLTK
jgi:hypothetical protein